MKTTSKNGGMFWRDASTFAKYEILKSLIFQGKSATTQESVHWILSPGRLPIPPHRQICVHPTRCKQLQTPQILEGCFGGMQAHLLNMKF